MSLRSMRSQLPEYLRLHCAEEDDDLLAPAKQLDRFCHALREHLGIPVAFHPSEPVADAKRTTRGGGPGAWRSTGPGHLSLDPTSPDSPISPADAQAILEALGEWADHVFRLHDAFRLGQAELATAVPVISRGGDRRQLFRRLEGVLRASAEGFGYRAAAVYLLDDATTQLRMRAQWGLPESRWFHPPRPLQTAVADLEALTGHAVVIEDARLLPHWNLPEPCRAAICLPVSSPTVPLGTFWMFGDRPRDMTPQETNLLEVVAGRIATELERYAMICDVRNQRTGEGRPPGGQVPAVHYPTPQLENWDLAVVGSPASGEDPGGRPSWSQWRLVDHQRLVLCAGSVAPAAPDGWATRLRLEGAVHATLLQGVDLDDTSQRLQQLLAQLSTGADAAHLVCAVVDLDEGKLRCQSIGSMAGYLVRPHGWEPLAEPSPPLDGSQIHVYPVILQHLHAGDALLLCDLPASVPTDSAHRLAEYILHHSHLPADELADGVEVLAPAGTSGLLLVRREA